MSKHATVPFHRRGKAAAAAALGAVAVLGTGLIYAHAFATTVRPPEGMSDVRLPQANTTFDYQIGGVYKPAKGVRAVSRDRSVKPAAGLYNICYVNAFQVQPGELGWWRKHHPDLLLRDAGNHPVIDRDWQEALLDTSTAKKRTRLSEIIGARMSGCAKKGFQAVEPDNLDSYERSHGRIKKADNAAFAKLLAERAHTDGLAIGQKNTVAMLPDRRKIGFDFAVAEECGQYDECDAYAKAYGNRVFVIEYTNKGFEKACSKWAAELAVVKRDLDVVSRGSAGYVFRTC
ncbi:endo alpha-1,4 polygalactosaminidase [Streptomyces sp. NPDC051014]|uniref:endo alpha-1,4 polygalactosaminidase n=1 Tax=Streptomyces sp. NPDC051014 TaxID=3155751 RepID=UPI0033EE422E